jgi:hypothetical protein
MICIQCRHGACPRCPEQSRQAAPGLTAAEKAGSQLCDCQHAPAPLATQEDA